MQILITGGSGFIGKHLSRALLAQDHRVTVLTRSALRARRDVDSRVHLIEDLQEIQAQDMPEQVINLAGENLAAGLWTAGRKRRFFSSRLGTTERLCAWMAASTARPRRLITASAIGYYGTHASRSFDESHPAGDDFAAGLCRCWEEAAEEAASLGVQVVKLRIGLVLGRDGGILAKMLTPFRLGLGGRFGDGEQWMSWIHIDDLVRLILQIIAQAQVPPVVNATAPSPVSNRHFTRALAQCVKRPAFMHVPARLVRALSGEMSALFLKGQRVLPRKALSQGFQFHYPTIETALAQLTAPAPQDRRRHARPTDA